MSLDEFAGDERRKFVRVTAEIPLKIRFRGRLLEFPGAFSRDVSTGGLGVELDAQFPEVSAELMAFRGDLDIEVTLPEDEGMLNCIAEVRWATKCAENEGNVLLGLSFKDLDDEQKDKLDGLVKGLVSKEYRDKILAHYEKTPRQEFG